MGSLKKFDGSSWINSNLRKLTTDTDTFTTFPAIIYAEGTNATVGLKGNTTQSSTPTPDSPIIPQGTGERTGNLLSEKYENRSINGSGTFTVDNNFDLWVGEVVAGQIYTISNMNSVYGFFTAKPLPNTGVTYDGSRGIEISGTAVVTVPSGCTWIAVRVLHNADNAMLNTGSTALPYEPYGYKLDISSANTTTPVYLGEVQTTREIKKLVLDGTESWTYESQYSRFVLIRTDAYYSGAARTTPCNCSHYQPIYDGRTIDNVPNESIYITSSSDRTAFNIKSTDFTSVTDFIAYLAAQYASGTPVTIWYVLATEETAVVNEPLMKIGDYADTVSGISIPITTGGNTLSVGTTVQPSEVTANYYGWHTITVHERESGQWD